MSSTVTAGHQIAQAALDAAEAGKLARVHIAGFAAPLDIASGSINGEVAELNTKGHFTYHVALSAIYAMTTDRAPGSATRRPDHPELNGGIV